MEIAELSRRFGINVEEIGTGAPVFLELQTGRRVLVLTDLTTLPFSKKVCKLLSEKGIDHGVFTIPCLEPVADEATVHLVTEAAAAYDYIMAVGAGTLNDLGKYAGFLTGKKSGIYATAPSMDGFASGVTPLIENGFKITRPAQTVSDILIDYDVLCAAPKRMIGAGVGDVLAKYCCLTDWRISCYLTGETYQEDAADLMEQALSACRASVPDLVAGKREGVEKLMNALLVSGYSMVIAGNSRPASGAEHHMSHFLEMDFLKRGLPIPLHGIKVGLGTLVSLYLYHTLSERATFEGRDFALEQAEKLPSVGEIEEILTAFGCPVRYCEIGVSRETVKAMLFGAHKIRDRFTVLTLYHRFGFMTESAADEIVDRFYS